MIGPGRGAVHTDRERAESFGSIADDYDRLRPAYPDALVVELLARGPRSVLDVGCGTGKLARQLAAGGVPVLGVEPDAAMAAIARDHGLAVEVAPFETWPDAGRRFDMLTCAQAWHWVDPQVGPRRARELLHPGGTLALVWNMNLGAYSDEIRAAVREVYERSAPSLAERNRRNDDGPVLDALRAAGFADARVREFPWVTTLSVDDWLGQLATYSDHHLLPAGERTALADGLRELIDSRGGTIELFYRTLLVLATT